MRNLVIMNAEAMPHTPHTLPLAGVYMPAWSSVTIIEEGSDRWVVMPDDRPEEILGVLPIEAKQGTPVAVALDEIADRYYVLVDADVSL